MSFLEEAESELKRADHLLFISLKYTRTCDIILNTIKRLISAIDFAILALLEQLKKEKKIKTIPDSPIERANLVKEKIKNVKKYIEYYMLFKFLIKTDYEAREEYRKNLALITKGKRKIVVTEDILEKYFYATKEFLNFVKERIKWVM